MNSSLASLFDILAKQLQLHLTQRNGEDVDVSWRDDSAAPAADLVSWSWVLSIDSSSRIAAAAPIANWCGLCNLTEDASTEELQSEFRSWLTPAVEETAKSRFGSEVSCHEEAGPENLANGWSSAEFVIRRNSGPEITVQVSIDPELESALGVSDEAASETSPSPSSHGVDLNQVGLLMDVEMPVSISLGRTKLRLKELLEVTSGSIVELDQDLSDEVEIRVNNNVIAYGEVVAVEGNYAVRILRMASVKNTSLQGILPERAA